MVHLRTLHMVSGLAAVALFVATGQYMHHVHDHLRGMPDAPRLLFRSSHIYLLLAGISNVLLGLYLQLHAQKVRRALQFAGSLMLLAAPLLFAWSFLMESQQAGIERPMSRLGAYLSLAGMILHLLASRAAARGAGGDARNP